MPLMLMLAAAKPWTYWMALPLLALNLLLLLAVLAGYYRKVAVPRYQWSLLQAELPARDTDGRTGHVTPLRRAPHMDVRERAQAA